MTVNDHIDYIFNKVNKLIDLLWKLQNFLPSKVFITIFKAFFRPHLDYDNVLCDQGFNNYSYERLELVQFHAWLAITELLLGHPNKNYIKGYDQNLYNFALVQ